MLAIRLGAGIFITVQFLNERLDTFHILRIHFMTRKQWFLIAVALTLATVYLCCFTNWFKPKIIQISYTERSLPSRVPSRTRNPAILFGFGGQRYRLSEIEVVPLAAWQTNKASAPLWHLVSNSRSAPVGFFRYGEHLRDMKPAVPGARPEPLESNVTYRLFLRSGRLKGQCDFQLGGRPSATVPK
jgi:hypothetical protein